MWSEREESRNINMISRSPIARVQQINSSFHRPHRVSTWERWRENVPDDFRFSVKMPKTITHKRKLLECDGELDEFLPQPRCSVRSSECCSFNCRRSCRLNRRSLGPSFQCCAIVHARISPVSPDTSVGLRMKQAGCSSSSASPVSARIRPYVKPPRFRVIGVH